MNNDLGARTRKAKEISKKSKSILSSIVKGDEISGKTCVTRTSAGFMALEELNGAIIVTPPSSALIVCELIERGLHPGLLVEYLLDL